MGSLTIKNRRRVPDDVDDTSHNTRDEEEVAKESWNDVEAAKKLKRKLVQKHQRAPIAEELKERIRRTREEQAAVEKDLAAVRNKGKGKAEAKGVVFEIHEDDEAREEREEEAEMEEVYERTKKAVMSEPEPNEDEGTYLDTIDEEYEDDGDATSSFTGEERNGDTPSDLIPPREMRRFGRKKAQGRIRLSGSLLGRRRETREVTTISQDGGPARVVSTSTGKSSRAKSALQVRKSATASKKPDDEKAKIGKVAPPKRPPQKIGKTTETENSGKAAHTRTNSSSDAIDITSATTDKGNNANDTAATTIATNDNDPSTHWQTVLANAIRVSTDWYAKHSNDPSMYPAFQALRASSEADKEIAGVLIAVMRQKASFEEWALFRRWFKNAKKHVKIQQKAEELEKRMGEQKVREKKENEVLEEQMELKEKWEAARKKKEGGEKEGEGDNVVNGNGQDEATAGGGTVDLTGDDGNETESATSSQGIMDEPPPKRLKEA